MKFIRNFPKVAGLTLGLLFAFNLQAGLTLTPLVQFNTTNGANPVSSLVEDTDGSLYGSTFHGGTADLGTVYRVNTSGTLSNLISFNGTNGANPYAGL